MYQDYVIKDGKFVGQFEEMYQKSSEIPWHQDENAHGVFSDIDIAVLRHMHSRHQLKMVADIGCGLGFFTNRVAEEVLSSRDIHGFDISFTAIQKARQLFPQLQFSTFDILGELPASSDVYSAIPSIRQEYDLVICKECHWYMLDHLELFKQRVRRLSTKFLYISQSFPESENYLGCKIFPNPESIRQFWEDSFEEVFVCIENDSKYENRPYIHMFLTKITL